MVDLVALKATNLARWRAAKLTRRDEFAHPARIAVDHKAIYQEIEKATGVHWVFVAVAHYRESSQNFMRSLGQGDPWNEVSTHVPKDRGPFKSFAEAAIDSLVNCAPYAARNKDWSIGGVLTKLEEYNGLKYAMAGRPSPYIWSGTDQYKTGKVLVDHGPIEDIYPSGPHKGEPVIDPQLGCAGLILVMRELDLTIRFDGDIAVTPAPTITPAAPAPPHPAGPAAAPKAPSFWSMLLSLFRKKT